MRMCSGMPVIDGRSWLVGMWRPELLTKQRGLCRLVSHDRVFEFILMWRSSSFMNAVSSWGRCHNQILTATDAASKLLAKVGRKWEMGFRLEQSARVNAPSRMLMGFSSFALSFWGQMLFCLVWKFCRTRTHVPRDGKLFFLKSSVYLHPRTLKLDNKDHPIVKTGQIWPLR
jgi:hypothetical protein